MRENIEFSLEEASVALDALLKNKLALMAIRDAATILKGVVDTVADEVGAERTAIQLACLQHT